MRARRTIHESPSVVSLESTKFVFHGGMPVRIP